MATWRGGTEVPYLPPPARAPPPGAASSGPGDARSPERLGAGEDTRCQAHPVLALAHEPPCQHKHDPGQPMQLAWKRQCWPGAPSRGGRMWGRRGLSPTSNMLAPEPSPGGGEGPGEGITSWDWCREGWKPREPGPACSAARRALLHLSPAAVAAKTPQLEIQ